MFDPNDSGAPGEEQDASSSKPRKTSPILDRRVLVSLKSRDGQAKALANAARLDSPKGRELHRRLLGFYLNELERQGENRAEMALDEEFYDNIQWSREDEADLRDRGMVPIVCNVLASTINWVLGTERRMRADYKILPRRKDAAKQAQAKTEYLKFVSDVNRLPWDRSDCFAEAVKCGIGWMEDSIQDGEGDPMLSRQVSWREMLWDSNGRKDQTDGRYQFRSRHVDLDILESIFPHRRAQLRQSAMDNTGGTYSGVDGFGDQAMDALEEDNYYAGGADVNADYARPRVRLIQCWFRRPVMSKVLVKGDKAGATFLGEVYDPMSRGHWNELSSGQAIVVDRVIQRVYVALMTPSDLLHVQPSPYRHNRFPYTPTWCYRRGATGQPYGIIRGLRTMQEDVNRRLMKALSILSSNKTIMDEGAVPDIDAYADEISRSDAVIVKVPGKQLDVNVDRDLAPAHMEIMSSMIGMIQSASGITDENMGRKTNATSGVAITARQDQGGLATAAIFDNHRLSMMMQGELQLSLMEQFVDEEKEFRVTTARGRADFVKINSPDPETGGVLWDDDITATKSDFVISEQAWAATMRQAQVNELMAMIGQIAPAAPEVALAVMDLVIEMMDIPARDEVVKRIRSATGMSDPDQTEPTPEEIAKQQAAADQQDRAVRMEEATIADKEASAAEKKSRAAETDMKAQLGDLTRIAADIKAQMDALMLAQTAIAAPALAPVADAALRQAGYKSKTEEAEEAAQAAVEEEQALMAEEEDMAAEQAMMDQQQPMSGDPTQPPPDPAMDPAAAPMQPPAPPPGA